MYKCPNCTGEMVFSPEKQKLVCGFCDSEFTVEEFEKRTGVRAEEFHQGVSDDDKTYEAVIFTCPMCGGELISTDDTAATFCSFCGSSVLLESRVSREMKPDYIIPFQKSRDECRAIYKKMMAKAWFAPTSMKKDSEVEKFRSIYMPYWVYSCGYEGPLTVKGEVSNRRGDYIYTKHYDINSNVRIDYSGISYDASSSFADNLSQAVSPFDLKQAQAFRPAYMTGHYADTKDTAAGLYDADARETVQEHAASLLYKDNTYHQYGADQEKIRKQLHVRSDKAKLGFFPVWFLANRNSKGDRVSYAVINGQTGKMAIDLPVAFHKYLIGSLILAVPFFLLLSFVLNITMTPRIMLIVATVLGLLCTVIANGQLDRVYTREHNLDDKGYQSKHRTGEEKGSEKQKKKSSGTVSAILIVAAIIVGGIVLFKYGTVAAVFLVAIFLFVSSGISSTLESKTRSVCAAPFQEKWRVLIKPLIGVGIALVVIFLNPFEDTIPYGAAIISMALIGWSFFDIIRAHNRLTERKLPQLGRRGGDENA